MRLILLAHRYLAVAVGLIVTLWCLSGFVMMYQAYPELTESERLRGLEPLSLGHCCRPGDAAGAELEAAAPPFRIAMLGGEPVLRLGRGGSAEPRSLRTGRPVTGLAAAELGDVARRWGRGNGVEGEPRPTGAIDVDQWTVQSARRNRPVHHFAFDDAAGTELYVSGASGEVFQDTSRRERVLAWLGAVPHWLYPLQLRRNGELWLEVVIWTSVVGTFLAATGLYAGVERLMRSRRRGRWSPYRGWWQWHHLSGLVFGILTLTWVFSGLLTVNPWGVLSGGSADYARALRGEASRGELERFLAAIGGSDTVLGGEPAAGLVELESAPFGGRLYVLAKSRDGSRIRLDASGRPAPLERGDVERALARLDAPVRELELINDEDSYYYGHKRDVDLPVYRAALGDDERTLLYVDATSGGVRTVDAGGRVSRWIRRGLHDFDFPGLRARPLWDVVVFALLAGVTLVCATGTWMALKRIRHDLRRVRRMAGRLAPRAA